jgi:hypothetical protein
VTPHETKGRHVELHRSLDELLACFFSETEKLPSDTPIMDLIKWSHEMTINPTCIDKNG